MKRALGTGVLVCALFARPARAQSVTTEATISAGHSTEESVSAGATQLRAFGDLGGDVRFFAEGAWGATSDTGVDAFGAAYPYGNRIQVIEAYMERTSHPHGAIAGLKAGRFRTPFGISSAGDQAYNGFDRAPLLRYDGYFAISNLFLESGVDAIVGVPHVTVESALGAPTDVGTAQRRGGLDVVEHAQAYAGPVIAGVSFIRTQPYQSPLFADGHAVFGGADLRASVGGVQVRGEFLGGRPFTGTKTFGWYVDAIVHRVGMGPVTTVARVEDLSYDTSPPFDLHGRRQTLGARVRFLDSLSLQVNAIHQSGGVATDATKAVDVDVVYSIRR